MPKSRANCCIKTCKYSRSLLDGKDITDVPLYKVVCSRPAEKVQRQQWLKIIIKHNKVPKTWQPSRNTFLCGNHFITKQKSNDPNNPDFMPTIFGESNKEKTIGEKALSRFKRLSERNKKMSQCQPADLHTQEKIMHECESEFSSVISLSTEEYRSVGCQTDAIVETDDDSTIPMNTFICNLKSENGVCHAEVQINLMCNKEKAENYASPRSCNASLNSSIASQSENCENHHFEGIKSISSDDQLIDLTEVTFNIFQLLLSTLPKCKKSKISIENKLLLFLMKMKTGLSFSAMGVLLSVHRTTASRTFVEILQCLSISLKNCLFWPSKEAVLTTLPDSFKTSYKDCRAIIDCSEVRVEIPSSVQEANLYYSSYKNCHTIKFLIACTPNGFISFISKCYGGRASDCFIVNDSGFLNCIERGDVILADKGFPGIKTSVEDQNAVFVMPPFAHKSQFSLEEVEETYKIASVRIHIERVIQRVKLFKILHYVHADMLKHMDAIVRVCCCLVNMQNPIIK